MPDDAEQLAPAALIIGCGYVGRRLAVRLVELGVTVYATTRSERNAVHLADLGTRALLVDVTQPLTFAAMRPALEAKSLDVFHLVPPGRNGRDPSPRDVVVGGITNITRALRSANVRRAVLTSSTAVYGRTDGGAVDADSNPQTSGGRGQLLREGEIIWLEANDAHHVVRLAGLYGPDRIIGLSAVREGAPIVGNPDALLNLIHVDDAADLLLHLAASDAPGRVELGCDDAPPTRQAYYHALADRLGCERPRVLDDAAAAIEFGLNVDRLRRASSKRCDNTITRERTGWSPRFAHFEHGLDQLLDPNAPRSTPSESTR